MVSNQTRVMASLAVISVPSSLASTILLLSRSTSMASESAVTNAPLLSSMGKSSHTKRATLLPATLLVPL